MARKIRFVHNDNNNAVIYARYSSAAQRDVSIEQQIKEATRFCEARGYHIINTYADRAITGTTDERPEFQRMLHEISILKPGYLVVWKTDRISRDRFDSAIYKNQLRNNGVQIEYVAETMPEDEADRILLEGIEEVLAEHFIVQHSKNVTRGLMDNAEKALYNGHKLFGYIGEKGHPYKIDPATGPVVRRIFEDYANGKPMKVIATELNAAGFKTVNDKEFTEKSLWHTLHTRSYLGEYKYGKVFIKDGIPRLVSDDIFEKCQELMEKNKHGGRGAAKKINPIESVDFWLTGHLYCGECGAPMSGTSGTSHTGTQHYYYTCIAHKGHKCKKKSVLKAPLERAIAYILNECINDATLRLYIADRVYDYYQREHANDASYERAIENNLKEVQRKLDNIMKAIEDGLYNELTKAKMDELLTQKSLYEDELTAERNRKKYSLKREHVVRYLECFVGNLDTASLRDRVLSYLIEKIYVYDDKVVINFYYSDDKREVNFESLNESLDAQDEILNMMGSYFEIPDELQGKFDEYFEYVTGEKLSEIKELGRRGRKSKGEEDPNFFG